MAYDAWSVAKTGMDMHGNPWWQPIYPSYGDYKMPLYIWAAALVTKVMGPSVTALRLVSAMAGTAMIWVVYMIGVEMTKRREAGLAAAMVVALLPWSIHFSRTGFEADLGALMVSLAILCLIKSVKKPVFFIGVALCGALGVYSYFSVRFVIPLMAIAWVLVYGRKQSKSHVMWLLLSAMLFGALLIPIYRSPYYAASQQFRLSTANLLTSDEMVLTQNTLRAMTGDTWLSRLIYHRHWFLTKAVLTNIFMHFDLSYLFVWGDNNLRHGSGESGLLYVSMFIPFIAGWYFLVRQHRRWGVFLFLSWLAAVVPASIPLTVPHSLRSLNALPILALVTGLGLYHLIQAGKKMGSYLALGIMVMMLLEFSLYWHDYWEHYPARSATSWQYGYAKLSNYLVEHGDHHVYIGSSDDRLYLYILFYTKFSPQELHSYRASNFKFPRFGDYIFSHIDEKMFGEIPSQSLIVLDPRAFVLFGDQVVIKKVFHTYDGKEQFYVAEKV
jgi:4-amino-4-deoxy-L-arabinose transferase-like glycosyltransferase